MPESNKYDRQHLRDVTRYGRQVEAIYQSAVREAAAIGASISTFNPAKPFAFADYPQTTQRINRLLSQMQRDIQTVIVNGVNSSWTLSNDKNNELANWVFGKAARNLPDAVARQYYNTNEPARLAFLDRKANGLSLSDRVWRYSQQFKDEIEMGLDLGIRDGLGAEEMARGLREYLQQPDKLFRRVRDEHGQLHLSQRAAAYHPGPGVYRSSHRNAVRLARTETNMAYRTADHERWQQMTFVVGQEVHLSGSHPVFDICDVLAGKYPKDFKFTGWHPNCFCFVTPILKTTEEMKEETRRILAGEPTDTQSVNEVVAVPTQFERWVRDNQERIARARSLPYFLQDNPALTTDVLVATSIADVMDADTAKWLGDRGFYMRDPADFATRYNNSAIAGFDLRAFDEDFYEALRYHGAIIDDRDIEFGPASTVKLKYSGIWQAQSIELERKFYFRDGVAGVEHQYFVLPEGLQGKGLSKQIFQALYRQYQAAKVDVIEVYANIDIGGYTWAKYGFTSDSKYAHRIVDQALYDNKITSTESDDAAETISSFFAKNKSASRFPMNLLADKKYGKRLLLGSRWNGEIDLRDADQRGAFERYLLR